MSLVALAADGDLEGAELANTSCLPLCDSPPVLPWIRAANAP
jgi:hypothetical protein